MANDRGTGGSCSPIPRRPGGHAPRAGQARAKRCGKMRVTLLPCLLLLAACDGSGGTAATASRACFTVLPAAATPPYAPLLVNQCTGDSWLLVRAAIADDAEGQFTYQWFRLIRHDTTTPKLVRDAPRPQ